MQKNKHKAQVICQNKIDEGVHQFDIVPGCFSSYMLYDFGETVRDYTVKECFGGRKVK